MEAEVEEDPFEIFPDEVLQLIFASVADCRSLIRCMAVSRAFREQSRRVPSLFIICPGIYSTYEQKLRGIYNMVKEFRALRSLVVRVGQPKIEPPTWARCMRYAEIGTAVDKFVFMAAKSGDFSEFDVALGGPHEFTTHHQHHHHPPSCCNNLMKKKDMMMEEEGFPNIIRDDDVRHRETVLNPALVVIPEECALDSTCLLDTRPESSIHIDDDHRLQQNLEHKRGSLSSRPLGVFSSSQGEEECQSKSRLESEGDSNIAQGRADRYDEASSSISFSQNIGQGGNNNNNTLQGSAFSRSLRNEQMVRTDHEQDRRDETVNRASENPPVLQFSPSISRSETPTFGPCGNHQQLPDFNLRQVIAPGNDVLKRMVPVIVFAIVQGLDEFRDSVPVFISNFRELKRFMLVDMVESVTVHMREHQIQQIREQQVSDQELGELVQDISRHLGMDKKDRILGRTGQGGGMIKCGKMKGIHSYNNNDQFGAVGGIKFSTDGQQQQQQRDQWVQEHGDHTYQTSLRNSVQNKGKGALPLDVNLKNVNIVDAKLKSVELSNDVQQDSSGDQYSSSGWKIRSNVPQELEIDVVSRQTKCDDGELIHPLYAEIDQHTDSEESTASNCCDTSGVMSVAGSMATSPKSDITGTSMQCQSSLTEGKLGSYQQVIGKWSCDHRLKRWLSGRQSLAGTSLTEGDQLGIGLDSDRSEGSSSQMPGLLHLRSFEEIMACRLGDKQQNPCSSSTSKEVDLESSQAPQQSSPHVTFSDLAVGPSLPSTGGSSVPVKGLLKHSSMEHGQLANQSLQAKALSATVCLSEHKHDFNVLKIGCSKEGHNLENSSWSSSVILDRFRCSDSPSTSNVRKSLVSQVPQKLQKEQPKQEFLVKELARKFVEKPEHLANRNYRVMMMAESTSKWVKEQSTKGHGLVHSAGNREGRRNLQQLISTYSFKGHLRVDTSKRRKGNQTTYIGRLQNRSRRYAKQHQAEEVNVARKTKIMKSGVKQDMEAGGLHLGERCADSRVVQGVGADGINALSMDIDQASSLTGKELNELEGKQKVTAARDLKSMQETTDLGESMQAHQSYDDGTEENYVCLNNYNFAQGSRLVAPCNPVHMSQELQQFDSITILDNTSFKRRISEGAYGSGDLGGRDLASEENLELGGSVVQLPGVTEIGRERQQLQGDARRLRWALGRFRSGEQFRSRGDMHRQIAQLRLRTFRGVEDDTRPRDCNQDVTPSSWRESFRERLGRRVREMQTRESSIYHLRHQARTTTEQHGEQPEVAVGERETRRERLREGVRQRQRDIEKEALFFNISFWRAEQVVMHNYSMFDVSMCIATHVAKPLTAVELDIISRAALAGPLLAATVTHVNREHSSHNL